MITRQGDVIMSRKDITIGEIETLGKQINTLKTIGQWKLTVKDFATTHNLTDREAIDIANRAKGFMRK